MTDKLKVGVIGVGGIAGTHMPGWAASPNAEVVVGADVAETALSTWAEKWNVAKTTTNFDEIISDPNIDIIDVCTPSSYHAKYTIAALEAGKHVICEKPLGPTTDEIKQMIAARDKSGKLLMTAQHMRYSQKSIALKNEIDTGVLGEVYHARSWFLRRAQLPTGLGFVLKKNSGGGPCIDIGVHVLDLTLWMMNNYKPVSVSGVARKELAGIDGAFSVWGGAKVPKEMDVEDFAAAFVRFENGATLMLEVSWLLHHDTPGDDFQVWLYGKDGGLHYPSTKVLSSNYETKQLYTKTLDYIPNGTEAHAAECIDFADAIVNGRPSPVPPEQSIVVQAILTALYESQRLGKEVPVLL
ncbi:MAG: Gfo/Idh/MocA family oxidoreductase [Kiritimatiellae bacterium]|nr:Gfo/Idh/MocA family oxidoreductase [Kiritimatiellia bacterium]